MYSKYIIFETATVLDALKAINKMGTNDALTLFVSTCDGKILGTLTDGDIRRSLINGKNTTSIISEIANPNFTYLNAASYDVRQIRDAKAKGIELIPILDENGCIVDVVNLKKHKSYLPVDAVLMAGGKGERLRPLTEKTPKPLLTVGDKCIIDYNVDRLISYGVKNINVTVNYLAEQIEEHFSSPQNGVQVRTFKEPNFLGTIGSVKFVDSFHNDYVLVMNSDLFTDIDYEDFFLHFQTYDAEMSIAAIPYNFSIELGILDLDGRNIKGIIEKPKYNYYANAGIYLIKKRTLDEIPENTFFHATHLAEKLIAQGKKVIRYPLNNLWIDIGTPQEYARANDLIKSL